MSCPDMTATILRVGSISIALYDYLMTIPHEVQLFRSQKSLLRPSRPLVMFLLIRYTSICAMVFGNVGFFLGGFSAATCSHYYLLAPLFKVFSTTVSGVIIAFRTFALSGRAPWVKIFFLCFVLSVLIIQSFSNLWHRQPSQTSAGNCSSGNFGTVKVAWIHYLAAVTFDLAALIISTVYLLQGIQGTRLRGMSAHLFEHGLLYFVALTAVNIFNLVLYRQTNVAQQSAAASLGEAITWIMSQKILIGIHDYYRSGVVPLSASLPPFNPGASARAWDPSGSRAPPRLDAMGSIHKRGGERVGEVLTLQDIHVHVHQERDVKVDYITDMPRGDSRTEVSRPPMGDSNV